MRIALLSDSESSINIFPKLKEKLSAQIADAQIKIHFVASSADLPFKVKQLAASNDIIFVFLAAPEKSSTTEMILEKLVDVELSTGKKVIKAFEEFDIEDISNDEQLEQEKERLAEKWADLVVKILFKPEAFAERKCNSAFEKLSRATKSFLITMKIT